MTNQQLFDAISKADDKYIPEIFEDDLPMNYENLQRAQIVRPIRKRSEPWKIALGSAACAAVIGGTFMLYGKLSDLPTPQPVYSSGSDIAAQPPAHVEPSFDENGDAYPVKDPPDYYQSYLDGTGHLACMLTGELGGEVYAVRDGEVVFADFFDSKTGYTVVIKHNNDLYTMYCYLNMDIGVPVSAGDKVTAGQTIGYLGHYPYCYWEWGMIYWCSHSDCWNPSQEYFDEREAVIGEWLEKPLVKPLNNISQTFDFNQSAQNYNQLIPTKAGEPVYAADDGIITDFNDELVTIEHENGIITAYYNLQSSVEMSQNTKVKAGDIIGYASDSGLGYFVDWDIFAYRKVHSYINNRPMMGND